MVRGGFRRHRGLPWEQLLSLVALVVLDWCQTARSVCTEDCSLVLDIHEKISSGTATSLLGLTGVTSSLILERGELFLDEAALMASL